MDPDNVQALLDNGSETERLFPTDYAVVERYLERVFQPKAISIPDYGIWLQLMAVQQMFERGEIINGELPSGVINDDDYFIVAGGTPPYPVDNTPLRVISAGVLASSLVANTGVLIQDGKVLNNILVVTSPVNILQHMTALKSITMNADPDIGSLSLPELTSLLGDLTATSLPNITFINLPLLDAITDDITITGNPLLGTISIPLLDEANSVLIQVGGSNTSLINLNQLTTILGNFQLLVDSGSILTGFVLNAVTIGGNLTLDNNNNTSLTSFTSNNLTTVGGSLIHLSSAGPDTLPVLSFPSLTSVFDVIMNGGGGGNILTTVNLSALTNATSMSINGNLNLTTISLNAALNCLAINLSANALSVASVNDILSKVNAAGFSNGNLDLSAGTNGAPTGGAGNAHVLSLQGRGWTVTHN